MNMTLADFTFPNAFVFDCIAPCPLAASETEEEGRRRDGRADRRKRATEPVAKRAVKLTTMQGMER